MASILRRNLISLYLHHPNPSWLFLFKTHFSSSCSSSSAAAEEKRVTLAEYLQQHHTFSPDAVSNLASSGNYLRDPENCDSVLSYFKEIGFSTTHLQQMVSRLPLVITSNVDLTLKPKIKLLQDAGLSPTEITEIVSAVPRILYRGCSQCGQTISQLKMIFGPRLDLFRFLKNCNYNWFLTHDSIANVELLLSCGISSSQMANILHHSSRFIFQEHDHIRKCVQRVEEMGCDRTSKMFLHAIRAISSLSMETWERKLEVFRSLGFSEDDIRSAFRRYPHVFSISESKIKESTEVLRNARNDATSLIVKNPGLLIYSVEKTLKPRLRVLEVLEKKNLLEKKQSLVSILQMSEKDFLKKFVFPYLPKVGSIFNLKKVPVQS